MTQRNATDEVESRFPADATKAMASDVDRVVTCGTMGIFRKVFSDTGVIDAGSSPDSRKVYLDLRDIWRPRIMRHMCERVLWGFREDVGITPDACRWLVENVVSEETERLIGACDLRNASPYGIPFPRASLPVDRGGYGGRDRVLLLSPYSLRDDTCLILSLVPPDEPGLVDALLLSAAETASKTLALPNEAYHLPSARDLVARIGSGQNPMDAEDAADWLRKIRSRCESTAAGRLAIALASQLGDKPLPDLPFAACTETSVETFLSQWKAPLRDAVTQACSQVCGDDPFSDIDIRHEADRIMAAISMLLDMGVLSVLTRKSSLRSQTRERQFLARRTEGAMRLCLNLGMSPWALPHSAKPHPNSMAMALVRETRHDIMDGFECLAVREGYLCRLDPVLAIGFAALGAGEMMPEAESLLRMMSGWARMCWAAAVMSHPEYGGPLSRPARPVDALAGVAEIKQRYDEVVPTLEPVWREAFERQWIPFVREIEETGQFCDETNRK